MHEELDTNTGADASSGAVARLQAEVAALRELLDVNESTAITQSLRADAALREERLAFQARDAQQRLVIDLIESSRDSVMVLDTEYRILFANGHARRNYEIEEIIGRHILEIAPDLKNTSFWARYQQVMNTRIPLSFEELYPPLDKWYSISAAPVGEGIALFYRDISDRRSQDEALARTEKLAAVGRMASSISHEINNPLECVTNLLYLIEQTIGSPDEMRTYAQLAASELARVSHIVTQTLKFHRQSTQAVECNASEIFESVLSLYQSRLVTLHTTVHRQFAPLDTMKCFAGDMRQVFANLIGNALDATGSDGSLWLRSRPATCPRTGRRGLRITVADNGKGMSAETQRKVFLAFFTTKGMTGSGLGMWVSEEIVRTHQGSIRLRSSTQTAHHGTVFTLFFPTLAEPARA